MLHELIHMTTTDSIILLVITHLLLDLLHPPPATIFPKLPLLQLQLHRQEAATLLVQLRAHMVPQPLMAPQEHMAPPTVPLVPMSP